MELKNRLKQKEIELLNKVGIKIKDGNYTIDETGDIIEFDSQYYEINNTNEIQLYAGQVTYNHQVLCETHLMRKVPLQLEKPII